MLPDGTALDAAYGPVAADLERVARRVASLASDAVSRLGQAAATVAGRRGKMVRPALVLLSGLAGPPTTDRLAARVKERLLAAAAAFELLHLASLTHDDIMDASDLRRGEASAWRRWGAGLALLAGDHLYGKAVSQASLAGRRASRRLCRVIDALVTGQTLELEALGRPLGRRAYLAMATAKTAVFVAESCALGASLAGGGARVTSALRRFGLALGQAYQLADDLLDWLGDPRQTGKPRLADLDGGRLTLPVIAALARRPARVGRVMARLGASTSAEERTAGLEALGRELEAAGAFDETARAIRVRTARALGCLEALPPGIPRDNLAALAEGLARREA